MAFIAADSRNMSVGDAPKPAGSKRRTDVQGIRGLAVVIVVLFHAEVFGFGGGFIGVDMFFVISGFVITLSLERELTRTGRIDLKEFYTRRIRRLLPASAAMLVGVALLSSLLLSPLGPQQITTSTGIAASLFSANTYLYISPSGYFDSPALFNPLLHMWSLAVEEQFYLVFPFLFMVIWRLVRRFLAGATPFQTRIWVGGAFTVFLVASFSVSILFSFADKGLLGIELPGKLAFYGSPIRAWEFIVGVLIALALPLIARLGKSAFRLVGLVGFGAIVFATLTTSELAPWPGTAALLPVLGTALVIIGGTDGAGMVSRSLSVKPMIFLGDLSYSWYLWHWPAIVFVRSFFSDSPVYLFIGALVSLAPAWFSFRLIEEPFRHAPWMQGRRLVLAAGGLIIVPILFLVGLQIGNTQSWNSGNVDEARSVVEPHVDEARGCGFVTVAAPGLGCRFPDGATGDANRIVLIGDSVAGQYSEAMVGVAESRNQTVDLVVRHGCPFAPLDFETSEFSECERFNVESVEQLVADPPSIVVLSTAVDSYLLEDIPWRFDSSEDFAVADTDRAQAWIDAWTSMIGTFESAGIEVYLVAPDPLFEDWFLSSCPTVKLINDPRPCGVSAERQELLELRAQSMEVIEKSTADSDAKLLDLFDEMCSGEVCATNEGEDFIYRDGAHITVETSKGLVPVFEEALFGEPD